jgi:type IV pilus assembly protein PilB
MEKPKKKIGELLIEAGLIDEYQLSSALGHQKQWGGRIASILISKGFVDEKNVASLMEELLDQKCMSLEDINVSQEVLKTVNSDTAKKYCIMPLELNQKTLTIAMSDPTDLNTIDELSFSLGLRIKPVLALESGIRRALSKHYPDIPPEDSYRYYMETEKISQEIDIVRTEREIPSKEDYPPDIVLDALTELLIENDIISKNDLKNKIRKKLKK